MSNDASIEKVAQYIDEIKNSGIEVLPPDINLSEYSFSIYNSEKIVLGFNMTKGIGVSACEKIIKTRETQKNYKFNNLMLCIRDLKNNGVTFNVIKLLTESGCFNSINKDHSWFWLINNIKVIYDSCDTIGLDGKPVISMAFNNAKPTSEDILAINEKQYQLLSISFAEHPIIKIKAQYKNLKIQTLKEIANDNENTFFRTICIITGIREITDSKRHKMAFLRIEDETKLASGVVFGSVYAKIADQLKNKEAVALSIRKDFKKEGNLIILNAHKINTI